jgi:acyl transferase domain-containing protein/NADPH:quinone reductase-like Zn-dependent oxidoreductase/surfactin synthase thioesterase subunit/SAM-dependent methyltransferase/NAD(P)-dependent dehydrogenase (short-subunit alcohol dehydrogenase family)/aryl carrier-like protein
MTRREPLAIIGIGCRFPGDVNNPEEFWKLIIEKGDAVTDIPPDRWDVNAKYAPDFKQAGKINVRRGGFIKDIDKFDASFFGISPMEASRMDPQQRMLLELSYEAMENAGLTFSDLDGSRTSVLIGISSHDYGDLQNTPVEQVNIGPHTNLGSALCITANRISYFYNLKGLSMALDTACSSSLNAVHLACRNIWEGDADMAFAGGVNAILKPEPQMGFSKGGFLSPDGKCFAFDSRANGYIRSEGAGIIIIKPLSRALEDNDLIYATIRGSGVNQDGTTNGISVPNPVAQQEMIRMAYEDAGVDTRMVKYIEAHGTGTFVGDPIEAISIGRVVGKDRTGKFYIGSVKTNLGHMEPASGIAGIIKLALAMDNRVIPPNINFRKPNPNIPFEELKLEVPVEPVKWEAEENGSVYGGVNNFGFGGANVHVVLEGIRRKKENRKAIPDQLQMLTLSARDPEALQQLAGSYITYLGDRQNQASLAELCYSAAVRRTHHPYRLSVVGGSKQEMADHLQKHLDGESLSEVSEGRTNEVRDKIVFVFSGQGPQWWAMGRQLLDKEPRFAETIHKLDKLLSKHANWSLLDELTKDEKRSRISETHIAQPAIFSIQIALFEMWKAMGVHPAAVVGHSIGEVPAAYVSGALTLEQAVLLIFHRSRVQYKATDKGRMLAAGLTIAEATRLIQGREDKVSIGAVNGPAMVSLSGDTDVIEQISEELEKQDIFNRMLKINVPFHCHHMEPLKEELLSSLDALKPSPTKIPFYSTVTGMVIDGKKLDNKYWYRNVRETVNFAGAIEELINDGFDTFIELGPHPIHALGINDLLAARQVNGLVVPSIRRQEEEKRTFLSSAGMLHTWGCELDWKTFFGKQQFVRLPAYPWQKESHWLETEEGRKERLGSFVHPHLKRKTVSARENQNIIWEINLDKRTHPYIDDHKVQGPIIYPGAGHVELAISAGLASFGQAFEFLEDLNFENALFLPDAGEPVHIQMDISHDGGDYFIYSRPRSENASWTMCSNGKMNHIKDSFRSIAVDFEEIRKRVTVPVPVKALHDELLESGLYLGPSFRAIKHLWRSEKEWESFSEIEVHESIRSEFFQFNLHPGVLDSCFQTVFGIFNTGEDAGRKMGVYIPVHIDRIKFHQKPGSFKMFVYGSLREWTDEYALGELWIFNEEGELIAEFQGFRSQYLKGSRGESAGEQEKWFYEYNWTMKSRADQELVRNPGKYLPSPNAIRKHVEETINEINALPEQAAYYQDYEPRQYRLTIGYICNALRDMGMVFTSGTEINVKSLMKEFGVIGDHHRLFHHIFNLLKNAGIVEGGPDDYTVVQTPDFRDVTLWIDEINEQFPQFRHETTLLGRCGPEIAGVLTGKVDPIQLIFPEDQWDLIVKYYVEGFAFKKYNDLAARVVTELVSGIPEDQTLRILEIGAGTGGMTQAVLPLLPAGRTEYFYTDLSHMFMLKAQQRFARYPFVQYKLLDIEKDPADQGFDINSFDLVIASDVMHATRNLKNSFSHVKRLLASEGILLMLEVTNSPVYLDFIFGMTEGWWLFEDTDIRPEHATMGPDRWKKILEREEFSDVAVYSDFKDNEASCQSVILARNKKLDLTNRALEESPKLGEADWLLFADDRGVAPMIQSRLAGLGKRSFMVKRGDGFRKTGETGFEIDPGNQDHVNSLIDKMAENGRFQGIIFLWGLDSVPNDQLSTESIIEAEDQSSRTMMNLMKSLNSTHYEKNPEIWMITSGAQSVAGIPETVRLSQAGLRGVNRVIINEFPVFNSTMVDFSDPVREEEINGFIDEIIAGDNEDEIAFRGKKRFINRLERISTDSIAQRALRTVRAEESPFRVTIDEYGVLENLVIRETTRREPADDEVEVDIRASALNFRDIMLSMGLLSDNAIKGGLFGKTMGLECAGIISATGKNVKDVKVGDEVMATAPSCLGKYAYPKACHVVRKPASLSFPEAATLPVVYVTAYYSLVYLCRIRKDEKILIHAAAGGVGIAAIHIAKSVGAQIYATVGSEEKRAYVESLGVPSAHILNSRSLEFADHIMELTGGAGVDIVLNSLSGKAIHKSIRCLAPYGRFVEIGKTDIYRNSKLGLQPFGNNLAYFGVDVDRLFKQKETFSGELFQEAIDFFVDQQFPVHPTVVYPIAKIKDAFQFMAGARHIGKIVISMEGEVQVAPPREIRFRENASYLLTGGCSGFGLAVADWMTTRGARNLVLMSRSGPKTEEEKRTIEAMRNRGVHVMIAKGDVSLREDVERIMREVKEKMPPLKGIQHAAMVLDDGSIPEIDHERYLKVFRPKGIGCWLLHEATRDMELDHFVLYSSISSIYGNPGQVSYVAGNSFLENFAQYRRSRGMAAMAINWGVLGDVGFVARSGNVGGLLYKQGWKTFTLKQSTDILEQMLLTNPVQRVATDSDWEMVGNFYPHSCETSRFGHLIREKELSAVSSAGGGDGGLNTRLKELSKEEQSDVLVSHLKNTFARVLGASSDKVDPTEPVTKYGLDSLMANQIRNWIQSSLSVDYSMMRIMKGPTLIEMTEQILNEMNGQLGGGDGHGEEKTELDKWVIRAKKIDNPRMRLFCLPYFAGGASVYNSWHESLEGGVEVCAIQYPGREERVGETPFDYHLDLVKAIADAIDPLLNCPIAFYSHSAGAGIGLELARYLRREKGIQPVKFIVGGWRSPHLVSPFKFLDAIRDDEVYMDKNIPNIINHLRSLEIPESVLQNRELIQEMLPALRADILLGKRYKYYEDEPLSCALTAIAGKDDSVFSPEQVKQWEKHTSGEFKFKIVNGSHLFCRDNKEELLELINEELYEFANA